jgi:hypothetical protein
VANPADSSEFQINNSRGGMILIDKQSSVNSSKEDVAIPIQNENNYFTTDFGTIDLTNT